MVFRPDAKTSKIDGVLLMELLAETYYQDFLDSYSENDSILELSLDGLGDLDYLDQEEYLEVNALHLQRYINQYRNENSNYRDPDTGETFASLSEKIGNFIDIELERFQSFVLQNGLSKDRAGYGTRLDYTNRLLETNYQKNMASYDVRLEAIDMYDDQMARIVLVPTNDESEEFYMSRTKIGTDYFAEEADSALEAAVNLKEQIDFNIYTKGQMEVSAADEAVYEQADQMADRLTGELGNLAEQSQKLSDAYIEEKRNGYLKIGTAQSAFEDQADLANGVLYSAGFAVLLGVCLVTVGIRRKKR